MQLICFGAAPMHQYENMAEGIAHGRLILMRSTREDFGYDVKRWYDFLADDKRLRPSRRAQPGIYPDYISHAVNSTERQVAVEIAEAKNLHQQIRMEQRKRIIATDLAEKKWAGMERHCPKCKMKFVSVQDRGQCPKCGFIFFASHPDDDPDWWRDYTG